jgi:hypothetical protein
VQMKKVPSWTTHVYTVHRKSDFMAGTCRLLMDMCLEATVEPLWNSTKQAHHATTVHSE